MMTLLRFSQMNILMKLIWKKNGCEIDVEKTEMHANFINCASNDPSFAAKNIEGSDVKIDDDRMLKVFAEKSMEEIVELCRVTDEVHWVSANEVIIASDIITEHYKGTMHETAKGKFTFTHNALNSTQGFAAYATKIN